jgi:hypothetical protein
MGGDCTQPALDDQIGDRPPPSRKGAVEANARRGIGREACF